MSEEFQPEGIFASNGYDDPFADFADESFSSPAGEQQFDSLPALPTAPSMSMQVAPPANTGPVSFPNPAPKPVPGLDIVPNAARQAMAAYQPQFQYQPGYGGQPMGQAMGQPEEPMANSLGLSLVLAGLGAAVGGYYGGGFGILAGSLFGGSAVNAYRAYSNVQSGSDAGDREAKVSATYALVAGGLGAAVWYKFVPEGGVRMRANPPSDPPPDEEREYFSGRPCGSRPILPR